MCVGAGLTTYTVILAEPFKWASANRKMGHKISENEVNQQRLIYAKMAGISYNLDAEINY